jgi:hypothetical protein
MLYDEHDLAVELAAQIGKTDLGVTEAHEHDIDVDHAVHVRLDNGQEFLLTVTRWGGPRA